MTYIPSATRTHVVIKSIERLKSSASGNPRFKMTTDRGVIRTPVDGAVNFEVENHKPRWDSEGRPAILVYMGSDLIDIEDPHKVR